MRPTRRWTKGMVDVCRLGLPHCCLQRHAGARVVARDQSLLRVLAFDGGLGASKKVGERKKLACKSSRDALSSSTFSVLHSREDKLPTPLQATGRRRGLSPSPDPEGLNARRAAGLLQGETCGQRSTGVVHRTGPKWSAELAHSGDERSRHRNHIRRAGQEP